MTPIVADSVSHRTRFAWLVAAFAASVALTAAMRPAELAPQAAGDLRIGRCAKAHRHAEPAPVVETHGRPALPAACVVYEDRLLRLAACTQLPRETQSALREAWQQADAAWTSLPDEARRALADGCRMGTAALDETAVAISCDIASPRRR